ncbi:two-component response regulator VirG [Rhabdaerophilaceae bacterium]
MLPSHPSRVVSKHLKDMRILIVDDAVIIRGTIRGALEKLDRPISVIEAAAGDEALAIMRQTKVDVIFCDINLPGISGPEALAHAYAEQERPPFMVLMSSMKSDAIRAIGQKLRVYEFLEKPFRSTDVLNAISAYDRLERTTRTLLVDDSGTARKLMRRILERSQFRLEIFEAESGEQALKMAGIQNFDAIFLDANMPGMSGPETAGHLLAANPATQIVMVSTEQQIAIIRSSQYAGACAFLKKPFEPSDVDAVLHSAFELRTPSLAKPTHAVFSESENAKSGQRRKVTSKA